MFAILAQVESSDGGGGSGGLIAAVVVGVLYIVSMWKIFTKMGAPGWAGIVPIFNLYTIFKRSRPKQAVLFTILGFVCGIGSLIAIWDLAKLFGKSAGYFIGMLLLPFIFLPMLAFGGAKYTGPTAA